MQLNGRSNSLSLSSAHSSENRQEIQLLPKKRAVARAFYSTRARRYGMHKNFYYMLNNLHTGSEKNNMQVNVAYRV